MRKQDRYIGGKMNSIMFNIVLFITPIALQGCNAIGVKGETEGVVRGWTS